MASPLVAGIDSSTQQTKLVVVDLNTGDLVHSSALPHPDGTEIDPEHWLSALQGVGGLHPAGADALSITAQQHSSIFLDSDGVPVRDAILWNDLRASAAAGDLRTEMGDATWLERVGLLPDATHPVSKLRWLAEHEPSVAERVDAVLLPHDWLTCKVLGGSAFATTDRSDASATGYWSPFTESYAPDLIERALGHSIRTPEVLAPDAVAGTTSAGLLLAPGCGDNAATHLALGTRPGDIVISIGTSTTVSMRTTTPTADAAGMVDTMADARSGFLAIVAMLNGARVIAATARLLRVSLERLDTLASGADCAADGVLLLPYLDGERNPPAPASGGAFSGLSRHAMTPAALARATFLGLGCSIADAVDALVQTHGQPANVYLVGGGARSRTIRQVVADLTGQTVEWPVHREHAAYGAARQAAWALTGVLPEWRGRPSRRTEPGPDLDWVQVVRDHYRALRGR